VAATNYYKSRVAEPLKKMVWLRASNVLLMAVEMIFLTAAPGL